MQDERWALCPGYEDTYEVSTHGSVRRITPARGSRVGYVLTGMVDGRGYRTYTLRKGVLFRSEKAHRLVCAAFLGEPPAGRAFVNHKNGVKLDNTLGNLEWVSHRENIQHAYTTGLVDTTNRQGANHPKARGVGRVGKDGSVTEFTTIKAACDATPNARRDRVWMVLVGQLKTHAGFGWQDLKDKT